MIKKIAMCIAGCVMLTTSVAAESPKEILFRDIPWETTYADVCSILPEMDFWEIHGEMMQTYSKDEILFGGAEGITFSEDAFNVIAHALNSKQNVAGYTTSGIEAYFVFPVVDGQLIEDVNASLLYGATYTFEARDVYEMNEDMKSKLISIYGEPTTVDKEFGTWMGTKSLCTLWESENATLGLRTMEYDESFNTPNEFYISYVYNKTDELLTTANDAMATLRNNAEASVYGNSNTDGL